MGGPGSQAGSALRAARQVAGVSLAGMATRTSYSKPYLGQLETGVRTVRPEHIRAYERALRVRIAEPPPQAALEVDDVLAELRPLLQPAMTGGRVRDGFTELELAAAERLASWARSRLWQDTAPPRQPVEAWLQANLNRLRQRPQTEQALRVGADLADLAAIMSLDVDDHRGARQRYVLAAGLAHAAGEDEFAASALAGLAYQYIDNGLPHDAREVAQLAQYLVRNSAHPRLPAALIGRQAMASAMLGDRQAFERSAMLEAEYRTALGNTDNHHPDGATALDRSLDTALLAGVIGPRRHWPSPHHQYRYIGAAYRTLVRTRPKYTGIVQRNVDDVMARAGAGVANIDAFELISTARAYLVLAEPEQAALCVHKVLPMADSWIHGRAGARLRDVHHESAEFAAVPAIRDARAAIADAVWRAPGPPCFARRAN